MRRHSALLALALLNFVPFILAHSWVACTDYKIQSDADMNYYDSTKCAAYPRNWQSVGGDIFGSDHGYNYQATETQSCRDPLGSAPGYGYTATYPMAQYSPGQRVCLAWPSKNHVAETCTNQYIPDSGLSIYRSGPNPSGSDPTQTQFNANVVEPAVNGVHQNGVIDHKGFQNCPKFCENMDKSFCNGCFTVPNDVQVGSVYTFQWYWEFNAGSQPYTSCWEAKIVAASSSSSSGTVSSSSGTASSGTATSATGSSSGTATSASGSTSGGTSATGSSGTATSATGSSSGTATSATGSSSGSATSGTASSSGTGTASSGGSGTASSGTASSGTASGTGGVSTGGISGETVTVVSSPTTIPDSGTFYVDVAYSTSQTRSVVVTVTDDQGTSYGKGFITAKGKGTGKVTVSIFTTLTKGNFYNVNVALVVQGYENDPTGYTLDGQATTSLAGDKATYPDGSDGTNMASSAGYLVVSYVVALVCTFAVAHM